MINQRIQALREELRKNQVDAILIPSEDFHQSEYVGDHFKARAYISGFTGSAGIALITQREALLWTDGRYFIQAEQQLKDSDFTLMKMDEEGVPTVLEWIIRELPKGSTLAFDGRVVSLADGEEYERVMEEKDGRIMYSKDLIDIIWKDRPALSEKKVFDLPIEYSGESRESKIDRVREKMREYGATHHISGALDDNCWLFNFRGDDVRYSPLVLNYAIVTSDSILLYIDEKKLPEALHNDLSSLGVVFRPYNAIYEDVKEIPRDAKILLDPSKMNYAMYKNIPEGVRIIEKLNPTIVMKAIKNDTELKNIKQAQIKDGVAMVRFMKWLKEAIHTETITEMSASDQLTAFRKEQEGYFSPSFAPICGYRENAAIIHYESSPETNKKLEAKGLFLTDTGANYLEGSTDITRTFAMGPITEEEKYHFTLVLRAHIGLAMARFLYGASGFSLDILARKPLWDVGMDYNHGTGHGIGYLLNIHEAPTGFRYKIHPLRDEHYPIQPNMILTNEPGIYIEGKHGIRTENEMVVRVREKNRYGTFLEFEPYTFAPIDRDAIDPSIMKPEEIEYLNHYHKLVFDTLSPRLNEEEKVWLKQYTTPI